MVKVYYTERMPADAIEKVKERLATSTTAMRLLVRRSWSCPTRHSDIKMPSRRCEEKFCQFERIRPANLQLQTETLLGRRLDSRAVSRTHLAGCGRKGFVAMEGLLA